VTGIGSWKVSSAHQQPPLSPPTPQSKAVPQRAQTMRREAGPDERMIALMSSSSPVDQNCMTALRQHGLLHSARAW
jgi:hypothetical protein